MVNEGISPKVNITSSPHQKERHPEPLLLIAGSDRQRSTRVGGALRGLRARIDFLSWEAMLEALAGGAAAIVLVLPIRRVAMTTAVKIVRDHPDGLAIPLYCVVREDTSSRLVRRLYGVGANVVLEWPRERTIFKELFAESFGITRVRGRAPEADKALTHSVRAHLRIHPELDSGRLRLFARDGMVSVSGQIRSLAQRQQILDTIAAVPGVRVVIGEALRVAPSGISDKTLERRIRELLRQSAELDNSTVWVGVRNGHVQLGGTVKSRGELRQVENLITNLKGPRSLTLELGVSVEQQRADRQQTSRYRKALEILYPEEDLSVTFINGVAVLTGKVSQLSIKRSVAKLLDSDAATREVVNKIRVE